MCLMSTIKYVILKAITLTATIHLSDIYSQIYKTKSTAATGNKGAYISGCARPSVHIEMLIITRQQQ